MLGGSTRKLSRNQTRLRVLYISGFQSPPIEACLWFAGSHGRLQHHLGCLSSSIGQPASVPFAIKAAAHHYEIMASLWQNHQLGLDLSKISKSSPVPPWCLAALSWPAFVHCGGVLCTCSLGFLIHACPEVETCDVLRFRNLEKGALEKENCPKLTFKFATNL